MFIFDNHVHIGKLGPLWTIAPETLIDAMKRDGINMCCVQGGLPLTMEEMIENTDLVAKAVKMYPKELPCGITTINPRLGDAAVKEMERAFRELGLKGLKLLPPYHNFHVASELTRPLMELCEKYGGLVQVHSDWSDARSNAHACAELALRFPKVPVIVCHTPRDPINYAKDMSCGQALLKCSNTLLDLSAGLDSGIEALAKEIGPDRLVWGSDWPAFAYRYTKARVEVCNLPEDVKAKILGLNALRILGVDIKE